MSFSSNISFRQQRQTRQILEDQHAIEHYSHDEEQYLDGSGRADTTVASHSSSKGSRRVLGNNHGANRELPRRKFSVVFQEEKGAALRGSPAGEIDEGNSDDEENIETLGSKKAGGLRNTVKEHSKGVRMQHRIRASSHISAQSLQPWEKSNCFRLTSERGYSSSVVTKKSMQRVLLREKCVQAGLIAEGQQHPQIKDKGKAAVKEAATIKKIELQTSSTKELEAGRRAVPNTGRTSTISGVVVITNISLPPIPSTSSLSVASSSSSTIEVTSSSTIRSRSKAPTSNSGPRTRTERVSSASSSRRTPLSTGIFSSIAPKFSSAASVVSSRSIASESALAASSARSASVRSSQRAASAAAATSRSEANVRSTAALRSSVASIFGEAASSEAGRAQGASFSASGSSSDSSAGLSSTTTSTSMAIGSSMMPASTATLATSTVTSTTLISATSTVISAVSSSIAPSSSGTSMMGSLSSATSASSVSSSSSSPTSTALPSTSESRSSRLSTIIGPAVVIPLGLAILAIILFMCFRRRGRQTPESPPYGRDPMAERSYQGSPSSFGTSPSGIGVAYGGHANERSGNKFDQDTTAGTNGLHSRSGLLQGAGVGAGIAAGEHGRAQVLSHSSSFDGLGRHPSVSGFSTVSESMMSEGGTIGASTYRPGMPRPVTVLPAYLQDPFAAVEPSTLSAVPDHENNYGVDESDYTPRSYAAPVGSTGNRPLTNFTTNTFATDGDSSPSVRSGGESFEGMTGPSNLGTKPVDFGPSSNETSPQIRPVHPSHESLSDMVDPPSLATAEANKADGSWW